MNMRQLTADERFIIRSLVHDYEEMMAHRARKNPEYAADMRNTAGLLQSILLKVR